MVHNPTHTEINYQLYVNASTIKIHLCFLEAPQKVVIIYKFSANLSRVARISQKKAIGSFLHDLLGFSGKTKCDMTWNIVG